MMLRQLVLGVLLLHLQPVLAQKLIRKLSGHDGMVRTVRFSPDGTMVATGGSVHADNNDWSARLWSVTAENPQEWKLVKELLPQSGRHYDQVMCIAFRPDGKRIAVADEKASHIYDISSSDPAKWSHIRELKAHKGWGRAIAWSKDGQRLFSSSDDATTVLWDLSSEDPAAWKKTRILKGHKGGTFSLDLAPNQKYVATGGSDRTVRIWDITDADPATWKEKEVKAFKGHKRVIRSLFYSPDGKMLVSASDDGTAMLFDVSSEKPAEWKELKVLEGHTQPIPAVTFSADSKYIATGSSDFTGKIWHQTSAADPTSWKELAAIRDSDHAALRGVAFWGGIDGKRLLLGTAGDDTDVRIWDLDKMGKKKDEL